MRLFFLTIFLLYGGMHLYAFLRARSALSFGPAAGSGLAVFMIVMTVPPFLIRLLERYEYELAGRSLSYVSYLWMAALFLFFCISIVLDAVNLGVRTGGWIGWISSSPAPVLLSPRPAFFAASGLALLICIYGYWSALSIRTERLRIETAKLPPGIDSLRIVQISDVHLGLIVRRDRLRKIVDIVKAEKPDVFISSGDLVDAQINHLDGLTDLLREVDPRYGKFAVTGNHEYYAGIKQALDFTRASGFKLLKGEAVTSGPINIVGVSDPAGQQMGVERARPEAPLFAALAKNRFTLFVKHRPVIDPESAGLFDLQLSGHTHKGQIYPFRYVSMLAYPLNAGMFKLPGSLLYVSRGTGTWGPPVRFLSPPEVTVIELVRE